MQCSLLVETGVSQLGTNKTVDGLYKTGRVVAFTPKSRGTTVMSKSSPFQAVMLTSVALGALCAGAGTAQAQFKQTNLVSNMPGLATITDSSLVNP